MDESVDEHFERGSICNKERFIEQFCISTCVIISTLIGFIVEQNKPKRSIDFESGCLPFEYFSGFFFKYVIIQRW